MTKHPGKRLAGLAAAVAFAFGTPLWADSEIEDGFFEDFEFRTEDVAMESTNDKFGAHVAAVPGFMVVAAPQLNDPVTQAGAVYLFRLDATDTPKATFVKTLDRFGDVLSLGRMGAAIAADQDWIAVGQTRDEAVTLHHRNQGGFNNWGLAMSIEPPDDPSYGEANFGGSSSEYPMIDIHGDLLIVGDNAGDLFTSDGSTQLENNTGFAFIFERNAGGPNNWGLVARLEDPIQNSGDIEDFGRATAIYDGVNRDIAVVGAPATDIDKDNTNVGEAYVFVRQLGSANWVLAQTLTGDGQDGRQAADGFGRSADVNDDVIVVGTSNGWNEASNAGSVHFYYENEGGAGNWGEVLEIGEGTFIDEYSKSLQLRGDELIVGAPGGGPQSRGEAYVYHRNFPADDQWGRTQTLTSSNQEVNDEFASGVALYGGFAIIGDRGRDSRNGDATRTGSAYVFFDDLLFCDDFEQDPVPIR